MLRLFLWLAALFAATAAFARTPAPVLATHLSSITVTAPTGTPQALDNTLAPIILIGPQTLEAFPDTDIATLLQFHAGLDVANSGGPGQPVSLFLRGTGSAQTLVLVDGIRVNRGAIGGPALANIFTSSIERVEVVEAPRSALYGSDAIGGVVSITLKQPPRRGFDGGAVLSGGRYATRGADVHAGGGNDSFFGGADMNWFETAGFPPEVASDNASAYRNQSLHAVMGAQNDTANAYATFWRSSGTTNYLDFALNPASEDYTDRVGSVHLERTMSSNWQSRVILGQFFDDIQQLQSSDYTRTWRNSLDWRNDLSLGTHQLLSVGAYLAHEHVSALSFGTGYDEITRTQALYAQDQLAFGPHQVILAARESHFSSFGNQFTWNADYGLRFAREWRFTAGAGTGFRAPTATDRFGFGGNPDLKPEYSHAYNLGLYRDFGSHAVLGLQLYRNRIADLITFEATPGGGQEANIGRATITGANLSLQAVYGRWRIEPAFSFQRPLNDETGGYLPRRSRKSATLDLAYDTGRWQAGLYVLASGPRKDSDFTAVTDAGYVLTDLTGAVAFAPHWRLRARIENVFDVHYQSVAGYANAGRGLYLALSYDVK
ncbi:MAG TPA: TonB-dependent receptor [Gammaproteobacteria bacterium]|nr:TonB-dependent receptor [Gammaproteobacteria bacterium]